MGIESPLAPPALGSAASRRRRAAAAPSGGPPPREPRLPPSRRSSIFAPMTAAASGGVWITVASTTAGPEACAASTSANIRAPPLRPMVSSAALPESAFPRQRQELDPVAERVFHEDSLVAAPDGRGVVANVVIGEAPLYRLQVVDRDGEVVAQRRPERVLPENH